MLAQQSSNVSRMKGNVEESNAIGCCKCRTFLRSQKYLRSIIWECSVFCFANTQHPIYIKGSSQYHLLATKIPSMLQQTNSHDLEYRTTNNTNKHDFHCSFKKMQIKLPADLTNIFSIFRQSYSKMSLGVKIDLAHTL